jgi:PAS domain S-box-containing protein
VKKRRPTFEELEKRVAAAEPIVEALKHHEVDAIIGEEKISFLLLKEVGQALLSSEVGFRTIFELPGVAMIQADTPALRFTRVNKGFCAMTGYSAAELLTKTYIGLTHHEDRLRDMKEISQVLRGTTDSWFIEKRCVCKDGSVTWVSVNGAVIRDDSGRAIRIMAMIADITARKKVEIPYPLECVWNIGNAAANLGKR